MLVIVIEIVKGSRQNECLANFAQRDGFRRVAERGLKAFDGFPQWLETEPERLIMHRHDKLRAGSVAISTACSGVQCKWIQGLYAPIDMIARSISPLCRGFANGSRGLAD
jgi:hypothetical protein